MLIFESPVTWKGICYFSLPLMQQTDNAASSSSSSGTPAAKTPGQQHQICVSQSQATSSVVNKIATSSVVSVASLMTTATPVAEKATVSGIKLPSHLSQRKLESRCEFCTCLHCKWKNSVTCVCDCVKVTLSKTSYWHNFWLSWGNF